MMTLKEVREAYEGISGALSSVIRQINFAGIAIAWIFVDKDNKVMPPLLLVACLCIVVSIVLDALQYFMGTIIWYNTYRKKHKVGKKDEEITISDGEKKNVLPWICWYSKCIITIVGYCFIFYFLYNQFC